MNDSEILKLFAERNELAIKRADEQYGNGCRKIARDILRNAEDTEEAVNDMWLRVWNSIPPVKPDNLFAFLSATVRNCALNRLEAKNAGKRGGGEIPLALEELSYCLTTGESVEEILDQHMLQAAVNRFLRGLSFDARTIFVERYTKLTPVSEIASKFGITESKVKVTLMRVRKKLKTYLKKEGWL